MDGEVIGLEVIKAGLKVVGDSFTQAISRLNEKRLKDKKAKIEKEKQGKKVQSVYLTDKEEIIGNVNLNTDNASENIQKHIEEIKRWADVIKFGDLDKKKTLGSVYVQLDTYLVPLKRQFSKAEKHRKINLETAILLNDEHCVILGQPGAGKTTSLKKVCDIILDEKCKLKYTFPILLRLRDLGEFKTNTPIIDHISKIVPIEFEFNESKGSDSRFNEDINIAKEETLFSLLNFLRPILILDGFDELRDANAKTIVLKELRKLAGKLTDSKFVLSCRTGEFNYELEYSNTFEIAPLNDIQIEVFVNKWLGSIRANDFLMKVKSSPFADTSIKPLSLAHLCVIYDRVGNIPDQPKTIYRKVVGLLIEEWDEQRSIIRKSAFEDFQADQKFEFLTHLAFVLTTIFQSSTFTIDQFKLVYGRICDYHNLPQAQSSNVVKELESHTGLFIESGYERFEFVHKSIQEYLTADYLVKLPSLNTVRDNFESLGSELAIAVSVSSNSSLYFIELVLNYFSRLTLSNSFYSSFISRIISENPSFKQDELVAPATLVLLSYWLNPESRNFNEFRDISISDEFLGLFLELSRSLKLKEQKVNISKFYKYTRGIHDNRFVELIRIVEPKNHKRMPSKIYLPIDFYLEFQS